MDNSLKPIEAFVKQGLAQRFSQVFGIPLVFSNAPDKKGAAAKLLKEGLSYPLAFASVTGEAITEGTYRPHALWRRGLHAGASTDSVLTHRLNLIPVTTDFEVLLIAKAFSEVEQFKRLWLLGAIQNALKFSVLYGPASLDIHVTMDRRVAVPQRSSSLDQSPEYEATVAVQIQGYMTPEVLAKAQAVLQVEGEVLVNDESDGTILFRTDGPAANIPPDASP